MDWGRGLGLGFGVLDWVFGVLDWVFGVLDWVFGVLDWYSGSWTGIRGLGLTVGVLD